MKISIGHLYPDLLDLYGDKGNILVLQARSNWRGIETDIHRVSIGDDLNLSALDILFIGGGSDREQNLLVDDLMKREKELKDAIEEGLVVLSICGGYQLLGAYYQTIEGVKIPGLGILDFWTVAGAKRLIGNIIVDICESGIPTDCLTTLVGFENHSGQTFLGEGLRPLGQTICGHGNNGQDKGEGVRYKNVFGTYLHGPLLPKNPHFADYLIRLALQRQGITAELTRLNDELEVLAHQTVVKRFSGLR